MKSILNKILADERIEYFGVVPFTVCRVINRPLLERGTEGWTPNSAIMLLIPYYSGEYNERNISLYAIPKDYHIYFRDMYRRVEKKLSDAFPEAHFKGFSDHSPISETYPASMAGLGVIGDMYQLINEKYGSHVFIGEILTDLVFEEYDTREPSFCNHCGLCVSSCPSREDCLSGITQKKGELSEKEETLIKASGLIWGCDVCRSVCPKNSGIAQTPIEFFKADLIPSLTLDRLQEMSTSELKERAFGWRGRSPLIRNMMLFSKS